MDLLIRVRWKGTTLEDRVGCLGNQHLHMTANGILLMNIF